jgi:exopolyphosphatase/guanosine-5'-triphosphate,3'-diphosphate pyrophosphatase
LKYAGIDIGSNAMRLLIAELIDVSNEVSFTKLGYVRLPIRLGSDVFKTGEISPEKEADFIKGMEAFKLIMGIYKVKDYKAYATSAMRTAINGRKVVEDVFKKTGLKIEIINGDKEAEIIQSTFHLLSLEKNTPYLYIDVGGGSTEISLLLDGKSEGRLSFKIGTVRMLQNKVAEGEWEKMLAWVDVLRDRFHPKIAIGSGGNINKIIKLCCKNEEELLNINNLRFLSEEMKSMTVEERMLKWDLKNDRADVIVPASEIFLAILSHAGIDTIYIPKVGLADGILYHLHKESKLNLS